MWFLSLNVLAQNLTPVSAVAHASVYYWYYIGHTQPRRLLSAVGADLTFVKVLRTFKVTSHLKQLTLKQQKRLA